MTRDRSALLQAGDQVLWTRRILGHGEGQGPALVFLHDALGSVAQWRDFPDALAVTSRLNAVIYDRPGHGQSGPLPAGRGPGYLHREALEVLPALLEALGIERPLLVGHSDGGTIALLYAASHPTTAVIAEAAHVMVEEQCLAGIRTASLDRARIVKRLKRYHGKKTEALFDAWANTWLAPSFRQWAIEAELRQIACPVLAIQGQDDEYGTAAQLESIADAVGGLCETQMLDHCGHNPHRQCRDAALRAMKTFIERVVKI